MNQSESHPFGAYTVAARQADRAMIELLTLDYLNNGGAIERLPDTGVQGKDAYTGVAAQMPSRWTGRGRPVYEGEEISWRDLAKRTGIGHACLRSRMKEKGITLEEAIAMGPPRGSKK